MRLCYTLAVRSDAPQHLPAGDRARVDAALRIGSELRAYSAQIASARRLPAATVAALSEEAAEAKIPTDVLGRLLVQQAVELWKREGHPVDDDSFLLYLNASDGAVQATLPGAPWGGRYEAVLDTASAATGTTAAGGSITVAPRSAALL